MWWWVYGAGCWYLVLPHSPRHLLPSSKFLVSLGFTTTTWRPLAPPRPAHTATTHLTHLGFSLYLSCLLTQVALRYRPWPDGHRRWISFLSELESDLMASTRARSNVNELVFFVFFIIMKKLHDLLLSSTKYILFARRLGLTPGVVEVWMLVTFALVPELWLRSQVRYPVTSGQRPGGHRANVVTQRSALPSPAQPRIKFPDPCCCLLQLRHVSNVWLCTVQYIAHSPYS